MAETTEIDPIKYGAMWQQVQDLSRTVASLETKVDLLLDMANRSKGGMWLALGLMGGLTTLVGLVAGVANFVKDHWR